MSSLVVFWHGFASRLTREALVRIRTMNGIESTATTQMARSSSVAAATKPATKTKLHGREFYHAIGQPRYIVAPMVDRSEFAWRVLTRSYLDTETSKQTLAYTPMLHARLFQQTARVRHDHFQPTKSPLETSDPPTPETKLFLDGNPAIDRPLFVQFCANKPDELLAAARFVAPYCDAVDLNLGCPQGIAKSGHYGAFLQEDWELIHDLINTLHNDLAIPVTAKMRILETKEKTLDYAKMILSAGASILTVHGRRREQKGHNTGLADWQMIRYLRDNLPPDTVLFANGNILNNGDLDECLRATGADGVMSAEGNLSDPTIFGQPPSDPASREYWWSPTDRGKGGYRIDGIFRRYMDIIYRYVLEQEPPQRTPLWIPGDAEQAETDAIEGQSSWDEQPPPSKKRKKNPARVPSASVKVMQGHLFGLLKPMLATHTDIRDTLARTRAGDLEGFERVLSMVEAATKRGLQEEAEKAQSQQKSQDEHLSEVQLSESGGEPSAEVKDTVAKDDERKDEGKKIGSPVSSHETTAKYRRPWWVAQPYIRPLPEEAMANGALKVSQKQQKKMMEKEKQAATMMTTTTEQQQAAPNDGNAQYPKESTGDEVPLNEVAVRRSDEVDLQGTQQQSQSHQPTSESESGTETRTTQQNEQQQGESTTTSQHELPQPALVCG